MAKSRLAVFKEVERESRVLEDELALQNLISAVQEASVFPSDENRWYAAAWELAVSHRLKKGDQYWFFSE